MARPKGSPKTGGRKKGTPNRATQASAKAIADAMVALGLTPDRVSGLTPLQMMLVIAEMRFTAGDHAGALAAAQAAAPYVHAKLSSSDVHVTGTLDTRSVEDLDAEIAELRAKQAAAGLLN
jgi:hypothetical protein